MLHSIAVGTGTDFDPIVVGGKEGGGGWMEIGNRNAGWSNKEMIQSWMEFRPVGYSKNVMWLGLRPVHHGGSDDVR